MPRKGRRSHFHHREINPAAKVRFLLFGIFLGVLGGGFAAMIVISMNKSQVVHDSRSYHPATYAVAEKFMCGCPECEKELKYCECSHPEGGIHELSYASERLNRGLSERQVVNEVYGRFGKIKPEYEDLLK